MTATTRKSAPDLSWTFLSNRLAEVHLARMAFVGLTFLLGISGVFAQPRFVPGRILVRPRSGLAETNFAGKLRTHGATQQRTLRRSNVRLVTVEEDAAEVTLTAWQSDPDIEFAERDYLAEAAFVPNDPAVVSGDAWHLSRIQVTRAWDTTRGQSNVVVAVLDSGVNAAHPDLAGQVLPGYDFVNGDDDPADDFGHGTAVAGTVAAAGNNGIGVAGVAYGCRLLPVKVLDASGYAPYSCIAEGIRYAVDQGARVINISMVGSSLSETLQDAVDFAWSNNVVLVAAAGNNGDAIPQYPAACAHVIGVSATEPDDSLAAFSSYGSGVTLAAPGDEIWTTQNHPGEPYGAWRGTSFASPVAAGAAALVISENPSLSNAQVVDMLEQTADDLGEGGYDPWFGYGRVNALNAVNFASLAPGALPPQRTPDPSTIDLSQDSSVPAGATNGVTSPSPRVNGSYNGLIADANGVQPRNADYFRLVVTASGRFTGRLALGGHAYSFHGTLDSSGVAAVPVKRGRLRPLALTLRLDRSRAADVVTGSVTDGDWTAEVAGNRNVFNARTNPAPQAGTRAFILERSGDASASATGLSVMAKGGAAHIKGRLEDGRAFSVRSMLTPNGDCPFHLSLTRGSEVVIGWLNFPAPPGAAATGTVWWVRTGADAFAATLQAAAAP